MKTPSARLSLLCLSLACFSLPLPAAADPYVRKNASSPAAAADIEAMNIALAKMRNLPCDNPTSWYYQGAIHFVPEQVPDNKLCPSYQNKKTDLKPAWDNCTHVPGSEIHFLVWHRLYILNFERIVRELSGKADFALPYWFYTNPQQRRMPAPFTDPSLAVFAKERVQTMNSGGTIPSTMDNFLDLNTLYQNKVFAVFNQNIDAAPHGAMHDYLGGAFDGTPMYNPIYQQGGSDMYGLMSQVQSAGFDPIFWLHHSNIDLLWQTWEASPNGIRPTLTQLKAAPWNYEFFDAKGNMIKYTIEEAYQAAFNVDYVYDQKLTAMPRLNSVEHERLAFRGMAQEKRLVWIRDNLSAPLSGPSVTLDAVQPPSDKVMLMQLPENGALVLELKVSYTEQPRDGYMVYVVQDGKKAEAGAMTFFGAAHHGMGAGMDQHEHDMSLTFAYDLSDEISADSDYDVVIESQTGRGSSAKVTSMSLYRY